MIKFISRRAACFLCNEDDEETLELYEYAIYIALSAILHIVTIIILGVCFNMLIESIVFYGSFISIRKFAGGYHAKTPTRCYLFSIISSIIILSLIALINSINSCVVMIVLTVIELFCVVLIFMMPPLDTENKPLNRNEKKVYKKITCIISISVFLLSLLFIIFNLKSIGDSLGFGIVMSLFVLIMRKVQIIFCNNILRANNVVDTDNNEILCN